MRFSGFVLRRWFAASCLIGVAACTSTPSSVQVRTDGRLRVLPEEFTSEVGCSFASANSNELSYYVATLVDLGPAPEDGTESPETDDADYPQLAGSADAARCTSTTTFSTASDDSPIEVGHIYAAIVDGYVGGSPTVSGDRSKGNWTAPDWQWLCGIGGLDEKQLESLVKQAHLLDVKDPESDAGTNVADAMASDASGSAVNDAGSDAAASTGALTVTSENPSTVTLTSGADAAIMSTAGELDAATPLGDASLVLGDAGSSATSATSAPRTDAPPSDAASSATSSTRPSALDGGAGATPTSEPGPDASRAVDSGTQVPVPRDWRAELSAAAKGDWPPPAEVVSGGQSGVRGCVPLF